MAMTLEGEIDHERRRAAHEVGHVSYLLQVGWGHVIEWVVLFDQALEGNGFYAVVQCNDRIAEIPDEMGVRYCVSGIAVAANLFGFGPKGTGGDQQPTDPQRGRRETLGKVCPEFFFFPRPPDFCLFRLAASAAGLARSRAWRRAGAAREGRGRFASAKAWIAELAATENRPQAHRSRNLPGLGSVSGRHAARASVGG